MTSGEKKHVRLDWVDRNAGQLCIGGEDLETIAALAGRTPFFAYDRHLISGRVAHLRNALPTDVKLHYAIKANPNIAVVHHLANLVDGFDVASLGELHTALDTGIAPADIGFAGPGKSELELEAAIVAGVRLSIESVTELSRVADIVSRENCRARVSLRINPEFELKRSGAKMGGVASQFGIDIENVEQAITLADDSGVAISGLHIYTGSQSLVADAVIETSGLCLELAAHLKTKFHLALETLNIGGGFGIPYFQNEENIDVERIGASIGEMIYQHRSALDGTQIVVELGRYLVGEAGYYVTRVTDIKQSRGHTYVIVDGGLHHHLGNSGNFGQVIRKNYPVVVGNRLGEDNSNKRVTIVGPLCTPLDIVADNVLLPHITIGDYIVVLQSGAYAFSASPHRFLGHPLPQEFLIGPRR